MNLTPLREIDPTEDEIRRVLRRAAEPAAPSPARRRARPAIAAVGALTAAAVAVAAALPGGQTATSALRAAAAAAADEPAPAAFSGYRYADVLERRRDTWATFDEGCMRRHGLPKPATPGARPEPNPCPVTGRATYDQEGRQEIWVDARWQGTRKDHGTRITRATGDQELVSAIRREFAHPATTDDYVYGEGPFARAPMADLPTDPDALLRTLTAAYADGRWAEGGTLDAGEAARRYALARYVAHLLAEGNATPALRAAAFGVLERMDATDLGHVRDARGREGHGIEIAGRSGPDNAPTRLRVIFDAEQGELLQWGDYAERTFSERTLLRTAHVRKTP